MERIKKFIITTVAALVLMLPLTPAVAPVASAEEIADTIEAILNYAGYDMTQEGLQKLLDDLQEGGFTSILKLFDIDLSDIIAEIQDYLNAFESEITTKPPETEPSTTEEPTTEAPTTRPPEPSYQYTPPVTVAPTVPQETTTYSFIPPEQIYTEAPSTVPFTPEVDDTKIIDDDIKPFSTAIGIVLLLAASVGVFIIVIALKKNRI
ncbi:MAG: hypothetical protein IJA39_02315 [Clostridia bacterium]|nr:hypothetical protein [Clostridia bacterium]